MEILFHIVQQILVMFIMVTVGFILFKTEKITQEGSRSIANLLIYIGLPSVVLRSFFLKKTVEHVEGLVISTLLAIGTLIICIGIAKLFFRKDPIGTFAASFANPGFFGLPIVLALLGQEFVFYTATYIAILNVLQFSYGKYLITNDRKSIHLEQIFKSPTIIALIIGLVIFFLEISLPLIVIDAISSFANINTALAMFAIGIYLAQTDIILMLKKKKLYFISFVRMIIIPLILIFVLFFIPVQWNNIKIVILILTACPVGANVAVYAQLYDGNYRYAVETVVISTLLSIFAMPIIVYLATLVW